MMKTAVLGAGFQGVCVALELARRGVKVDIYDKNDRLITQAGLINEGKVHLGFVYANDPTLRTAEMMIRGALRFRKVLNRWIDFDKELSSCSTPFLYAVHRDTLVTVESIRAHFQRVRSLVAEVVRREGGDYLGANLGGVFDELKPTESAAFFNQRRIVTAFKTIERSVRPAAIAERLRKAVHECGGIRFLPKSLVTGARFDEGQVAVEFSRSNIACSRRYEQVVNTLWEGRLAVDATIGIRPKRRCFYRFKYGIRIKAADTAGMVPSTTVVLGPYGDIVRHPNGDLYLSWYPVCLGGTSNECHLLDLPQTPDRVRVHELFHESFLALSSICPALRSIEPIDFHDVTVGGGVIVAWGSSDIDKKNSELHQRFDVGLYSKNGYHSVDTGKYTTAPMFAMEVANRICGQSSDFGGLNRDHEKGAGPDVLGKAA